MFKGAVWSAFERISVQGVQFALGIVLARILSPAEFGVIGLLLVFISIFQIFVDSGFSKALIQKQNRTQTDISTIFFFNLLIGLLSFFIVWMISPLIGRFYENDNLVNYLRVLSISLVINSFFAVPATLLSIELNFKSMAYVNIVSVGLSGIIAIWMALKGFSIWALVFQNIIRSIVALAFIFIVVRWKPLFVFSISSLKNMFSYGSKILYSSLLNVAVNNFSSLFIAKIISTKELGFYTRGTQFADIIFGTFSSVQDSVLLPSLSTIQHEKDKLIEYTRFIIKFTALVALPALLGLAMIANPLIKLLLTDKWIETVPVMQIFCVARLITLVSSANVSILFVLGRTDLVLKQNYIKLAIRLVFLLISFKYGIIFISIAELAATFVHFFINSYYPGKIMKYGAISQLKDLVPIALAGLAMIIVTQLIILPKYNLVIKLFASSILGMLTYCSVVYFLKIKEFFWVIKKINSKFIKSE